MFSLLEAVGKVILFEKRWNDWLTPVLMGDFFSRTFYKENFIKKVFVTLEYKKMCVLVPLKLL